MAEAAQRERWNHTAQLIAILAELKRDKNKRSRPFNLTEFHPFYRKPAESGPTPGITKDVLRARARQWFEERGKCLPPVLQNTASG